jgi:hypothetical protein
MTDELQLDRYDNTTVDAIYPEMVQLYADTHEDMATNSFYGTERFERDFPLCQGRVGHAVEREI